MQVKGNPQPIIDKLAGTTYFGDSPLWSAATNNNLDFVHNHYKNGGQPNQRFNGFGVPVSLIMGAVRNNNWDMADVLKGYGETILPEEQAEFDNLQNKHWITNGLSKLGIPEVDYTKKLNSLFDAQARTKYKSPEWDAVTKEIDAYKNKIMEAGK